MNENQPGLYLNVQLEVDLVINRTKNIFKNVKIQLKKCNSYSSLLFKIIDQDSLKKWIEITQLAVL